MDFFKMLLPRLCKFFRLIFGERTFLQLNKFLGRGGNTPSCEIYYATHRLSLDRNSARKGEQGPYLREFFLDISRSFSFTGSYKNFTRLSSSNLNVVISYGAPDTDLPSYPPV